MIKSPGDYTKVAEVLDKIEAEAKKSGLFIFTNTDLRFETPQAELIIDKDKANQLGIRMSDVGATLAVLLGGNNVNRINIQGRSYEVIGQVPRAFRGSASRLLDYQVRTTSGDMVPLSAFIKLDQTVQPNSLATFQQLNSGTFQGAPFPGRTVGEAVAFLQQKAQELFPQNMTYDFQGEARQFVSEGNTLAYTFLFALIVIYLVLAAQFESFRDPFILDVRRLVLPVHPRRGERRDAGPARHQSRLRHDQHLHADRSGDADRPHLEARHSHGRVRQQASRGAGL